jgi:predicted PurR-regulated permease PerM
MASSSSPQNPTRHIIVAVVVVALAAIFWTIADAIVIAFGGIVIATVLLSLSLPLARRTGLPRRWSLMIVIVGLSAAIAGFCWFFGHDVTQEVAQFQEDLPGAVQKLRDWLNQSAAGRMLLKAVNETGFNEQAITSAGAVVSGLAGATGNILLIIFLGIYFASDPLLYRDGFVRLFPLNRRDAVRGALDKTGFALRKWLLAQIIAMVGVGTLTGVALAVIGVPLALSLGIAAGLLEFIPLIGPILSAVPGVLLAFAEGPQVAFYAVLVYVAVQQIESNVLTPLAQRWAVKLPPVLGLLALVVCGLLFGVLGVIFAVPIAVVVMVLVKELYVLDTLEGRHRAKEDSAKTKP